jgi:hypothetical protein
MSIEAEALSIVEAALEHEDAATRAALIAERCRDNAALRARVEALLARDSMRPDPSG